MALSELDRVTVENVHLRRDIEDYRQRLQATSNACNEIANDLAAVRDELRQARADIAALAVENRRLTAHLTASV